MTRPTVGVAAEDAYARLPAYVRAADEAQDWPLLAWLSGAADQAAGAFEVLRICDPDQSVSGTVELANPYYVPPKWLGWLGWLVGINTELSVDVGTDYETEIPYNGNRTYEGVVETALDKANVRASIANAGTTLLRGSRAAIVAVAQRTLTGTRWVAVDTASTGAAAWTYNESGGVAYDDDVRAYDGIIHDPYAITVTTLASETPDVALTEAAALTEKPAGCTLTLITI